MNEKEAEVALRDNLDQLFAIVLWKAMGRNPLIITEKDLEQFAAAMEVETLGSPRLLIHGTEDGMRFQVMTDAQSKKFLAEREARMAK
jgi:hypothetical protein